MTFKIIRLLHLLNYLLIAAQVLFYLFALSDALELLRIEHFLEFRKSVDKVIVGRLTFAYYSCLALSLLTLVVSIKQGDAVFMVTTALALLCLLGDLIIAVKGNIPLNHLINAGGPHMDWHVIRARWLCYINYRGILITVGMLSLFVGLLFGSKSS
ncbi:MAG TPA: hypothetical protein VL947_08150 [Cytophagales bacterium]|nr:hypothetical protein [Cytophagales bacterium]